MGFFASNFCFKANKVNMQRNKLYIPIPHYAVHMDYKGCKLNEIPDTEKSGYRQFRSKQKGKK